VGHELNQQAEGRLTRLLTSVDRPLHVPQLDKHGFPEPVNCEQTTHSRTMTDWLL